MQKSNKDDTINIVDLIQNEASLSHDLNLVPDLNIMLDDRVTNALKNIKNLEENGDLQKVEILNLYSLISDSSAPTDKHDLKDMIESTKERMNDIDNITALCIKVYNEHLHGYIEGILNELDLNLNDLNITHSDVASWALDKLCVTVTASEFLKVPNEANLLVLIKIYRWEAFAAINRSLLNAISKKADDRNAVFSKGRKVDIPLDSGSTSSLNKALRNIIDEYK